VRTARGHALLSRGDPAAALAAFGEAVEAGGDNPEAHVSRAMTWLLLGDYARGWAEYEWRWRTKDMLMPSLARPRWDGSPLEGRTILLWAEQGVGDAIQFVRYAPLVRQRGGRVVLACRKPLLRLLAGCAGIDELTDAQGKLPAFDVYAPLMSLPHVLGTTLATVPAAVPYLHADPALIERWRAEVGAKPGFRIGIGWQGNPQHKADRRRFRRGSQQNPRNRYKPQVVRADVVPKPISLNAKSSRLLISLPRVDRQQVTTVAAAARAFAAAECHSLARRAAHEVRSRVRLGRARRSAAVR
jgi:hypothetical protein